MMKATIYGMSLKSGLIIVSLLLVFANGALDGAVSQSLNDIAFSPDKEAQRASAMCVYGLMVWPPTTEVYGVTVPFPSIDDVLISAAIASAILFFLHLIQYKIKWQHGIAMYAAVWLLFRLSGYLAIQAAGPGCIEAMESVEEMMSGLYAVSGVLGIAVLYKVVRSIKR